MKPFLRPKFHGRSRRGFSLVEAVLSIGIMSFGFLSLAPLLALGLSSARVAHENRNTSQIAATLNEQARQGTISSIPLYFDSAGNPSPAAGAAYQATEAVTSFAPGSGNAGPLSRLLITIMPVGSPGAPRIYADVFSTPPGS